MTAPIFLPVRDVARAAKVALDAGQLNAQRGLRGAFYRGKDGSPCAVGAYLTDEQYAAIGGAEIEGSAVITLIEKNLVTTDDEPALISLQRAHDIWANGDAKPDRFLATLNEILGEAS